MQESRGDACLQDNIRNNAYRILGLDGNASQRDMMKRYREITNRLKIDDHPQYDLDLNMPDSFRTESTVDDALKKLQNHRGNLTEYFFWFSISDAVDEEALGHLRHGDVASYDKAAQVWKDHSRTKNSTRLAYKRNLAILHCLSMFNEENDTILRESVQIWKAIVSNDKFWASFRKKYEMINDQKIHMGAMTDLKKNIAASISDVYYDLYAHHDNVKYVKVFHDAFGVFGQKTEKKLLKPIHQSAYEAIEKLNRIRDGADDNLDEGGDNGAKYYKCDNCGRTSYRIQGSDFGYKDGSVLCQECHTTIGEEWQKKVHSRETVDGSSKKIRLIEKAIEQLELNLKQLRGIGLYDVDQSAVMRDHVAESIRGISVLVHDQTHMREKTRELLELAKTISATASTRDRLESDLKIVTGNIERDDDNAFVLETGLIRKKTLVVKEAFIAYGKSKIYYNDASSILCYRTNSNYIFGITSTRDRIYLKLNREPNWAAIVNRVWPLATPHIVDNIAKKIFEKDISIRIGNARFDKDGYHRSRTLRSDESVLWSGTVYTPDHVGTGVMLYKAKKNMKKRFAIVSVQEPNALIIPELVKACMREFHLRHQS